MITQVFALPIRQGFVLLWGESKIYLQVAKLGLHKSRISRSASKAYHENRTILSGSIFEGINVTGATEQWELQEQ